MYSYTTYTNISLVRYTHSSGIIATIVYIYYNNNICIYIDVSQ